MTTPLSNQGAANLDKRASQGFRGQGSHAREDRAAAIRRHRRAGAPLGLPTQEEGSLLSRKDYLELFHRSFSRPEFHAPEAEERGALIL